MIDHALWDVIENGATLPKTKIIEGVMTEMPIITAKEKDQRRLEVKARSTLMMGIPNEHQLKFNSIKDAKKLLQATEKRFEMLDQTFDRLQKLVSQLELLDEKLSQEDVNQKILRSSLPKWNTHGVVWRNKADLDTMSMDDLYNNLKVTNGAVNIAQAVNIAHGVSTASTQVNAAYSTNIDNLSDVLTVNVNETIGFDKSKVECYNCHKRGHFAREYITRECRAPRNQDNKKESSRRSVPMETSTSIVLESCNGLGGYDWSDQADEGPNYVLMANSSSSSDLEVSNDSNCSKSCMETKLLKSQNDKLLRDLEKFSLMVLGYKTGEITISELIKKLEKLQKEKDSIQFNVDKFENASKSLDKLIECQIVDNCKKGLGYEKYNTVPPLYTGNFMPPTPDFSFTGLDEFVNNHVVKNRKSDEEVSEIVRKNDDAPIIEE
ncbi:retrovirus-related pol polyprotein from transposon TNT 1-94 [Tanacetum coccineum]